MQRVRILITAILLLALCAGLASAQSGYDLYQKALVKERGEGNLREAIAIYQRVVSEHGGNRQLAARAQLRIGVLYDRLGRKADAQRAYQSVVSQFADQATEARQAQTRLVAAPARLKNGAAAVIEPPGILTRQVWAPAKDVLGSVSPDGGLISFVHWGSGNLAVYDIKEEKPRMLTKDGTWNWPNEYAYESSWSPDGKRLAYSWFKGIRNELRIVELNDSAPRVLYANEEVSYVRPDAWSRDGKYILALLSRRDRTSQIAMVNVEDGSVRVLKSLDWRVPMKMSLSPDGRYIVYDMLPGEDSPQRDIYLLSTDGSREVRLVEHLATDYGPMWTPDGKGIVFGSDRTGTVGLYYLEINDGKAAGSPRLIQQDMNRTLPMGFSRSGSYYFARATLPYQKTGDIFIATLEPKTGKLLSPPEKVTQRYEGVNTLPSWSPDGKRLAYVSQRGPLPSGWGSRVLVIRSVETGEERVLNPKLGRLSLPLHTPPQWSPDGRTLLVVGRDVKGVPGIYLIDSESAAVTTVVRGSPGREIIRSAVWSRHGRSILYVIQLSEQNTLLAEGSPLIEHDLKTGQEKTLLGRSPKPFALSPDGKRIALCCFEGEVRLMPSSGGEQTTIFKRSEDQWINAQVAGFQWTPDGESLLFVNLNRKANKTELWQLSVATGEARKTGLETNGTSNETFRTLAMHPDGRRIAFVSGDVDPEVWVMENFLPGVEAKKAPAARR